MAWIGFSLDGAGRPEDCFATRVFTRDGAWKVDSVPVCQSCEEGDGLDDPSPTCIVCAGRCIVELARVGITARCCSYRLSHGNAT